MRIFGNIIWHFPFLGFLQSLVYAIVGVFCCLTVIGIPLGMGLFQLSLFTLAPFSKRLVSQHDLEMVTGEKQRDLIKSWFFIVRILYFPFGLLMAIYTILVIIIQFISIIGIPCGIVEAKALATIFNPVNKKCVSRAIAEEIERRKANNVLNKKANNSLNKYEKHTPMQTLNKDAGIYPTQQEIPAQQAVLVTPHAGTTQIQPAQTFQAQPFVPPHKIQKSTKQNTALIVGISAGVLVLVGLIAGYFIWFLPSAKDKDALRTYVIANNVFLRSSKVAGVEYNIISKIPYGSQLITYAKDQEWAEVKVDELKGFIASSYLLEWDDFSLLNNVWGSADTKEYIESSKYRLAILDYCKRNQLDTGNEAWQLYTLQKNIKPNNVLFPHLNNGYNKFAEFAFILKNNVTQERRFIIYSFNDETEKPIFLYEENAPLEGQIKEVKYNYNRNEYQVTYTENNTVPSIEELLIKELELATPSPVEESEIIDEIAVATVDVQEEQEEQEENIVDNNIYEVVDQQPEFPNGGTAGLINFISKNLVYPTICQENGIQGTVLVSFVIDKDGSATNFQIIRSVNPHLDKEALRVLSNMPKWQPGILKGVPVRVKYTFPIKFKLL